jgi:hypothetical protein
MESKKPFDQLEDPHKKAQDAIDHAREVREKKALSGFAKRAAPVPHLIPDGNLKCCSVCGYLFQPDVQPSRMVKIIERGGKARLAASTSFFGLPSPG